MTKCNICNGTGSSESAVSCWKCGGKGSGEYHTPEHLKEIFDNVSYYNEAEKSNIILRLILVIEDLRNPK